MTGKNLQKFSFMYRFNFDCTQIFHQSLISREQKLQGRAGRDAGGSLSGTYMGEGCRGSLQHEAFMLVVSPRVGLATGGCLLANVSWCVTCLEGGVFWKKGSNQNYPRFQGASHRWKQPEQVWRKVVSMAAVTRRSAREAVWYLADWLQDISNSKLPCYKPPSMSREKSESKALQYKMREGERQREGEKEGESV